MTVECQVPGCNVGINGDAFLHISEVDGEIRLCPTCYYAFKMGEGSRRASDE